MSRRSPANPRYRRDSQTGKTRKSAASAKPKREAGERGGAVRKAEPKKRRFFEPLPTPDTPEFRRWRRAWAGLFAAGAIFSVFALLQRTSPVGVWALVAAYTCLFSAILIDVTKVRRMRKEHAERLATGGRQKGARGSSAKGGPEEKGR